MEQNVFITHLFTCRGRKGNQEQLNKRSKYHTHTVSQRICIV